MPRAGFFRGPICRGLIWQRADMSSSPAGGDSGQAFWTFGWTSDDSLLGKILTNKTFIYLYLYFLVIC